MKKSKPEPSAYSYGVRLLSRHGYSEAVLTEKLVKAHYLAADIQTALEKLKSYGFVNDRKLAQTYFNEYVSSGRMGFYLIRAKLKQKKFSAEIIAQCLAAYDEEQAFEQAVKLAQNHFPAVQLETEAKIARYLSYRGFSAGVIQKTLQSFFVT